MPKQIFGWTNPVTPIGTYVGYAMAFVNDDGQIMLTVRPHEDPHGNVAASISMPRSDAVKMAHAIIEATQQPSFED